MKHAPQKKDRTYIVTKSVRGIQTFLVTASTAAEAKRKANDIEQRNIDVEPLDFEVTWVGRASSARLDGV
jgi:hypothetical protein